MTSPIPVTMELDDHPIENRKFMVKYHRYEPKIKDSTAIQAVKTCPRKYFFQIVLGRMPLEEALYFAWGSAYHKFRERLENEYGYGHNKPPKFDEDKAKLAFAAAAEEGVAYWKKHGKEQEPDSKYAHMTTGRLLKSFIVAFNHWKKEKLQGRVEVIAVEQPFNVRLEDGSYTSGKADQILKWNGQTWGRDFKTSSVDLAFFSRRLEPNDQFTRYTIAEGLMAGVLIQGQFIEVLYNSKPTKNKENGPEIFEVTTSRTKWQLDEFQRDAAVVNKVLDIYRENDRYPQHESSCPFCPFHSVCTKPTEGAMMAQLEAHFKIRPWDNTKIGMDT